MPPQAPSRQSTGPLPPPSAQEHVEPAEQVIIEESLDAVGILEEVSEKVEFLYNTPALDKLKHIAEKR